MGADAPARIAWMRAQARIRLSCTDWALALARLDPRSPPRAAAVEFEPCARSVEVRPVPPACIANSGSVGSTIGPKPTSTTESSNRRHVGALSAEQHSAAWRTPVRRSANSTAVSMERHGRSEHRILDLAPQHRPITSQPNVNSDPTGGATPSCPHARRGVQPAP